MKRSSDVVALLREFARYLRDELTAAQRTLDELSKRTLVKASEGDALQCLVAWRQGRIADESTIDLQRQYFVVHREYDEFFKGRIAASTGLPSQARQHLQRCGVSAGGCTCVARGGYAFDFVSTVVLSWDMRTCASDDEARTPPAHRCACATHQKRRVSSSCRNACGSRRRDR